MSLCHGISNLGIRHVPSWLGATTAGAPAIATALSLQPPGLPFCADLLELGVGDDLLLGEL
jgi:hypothetical protein